MSVVSIRTPSDIAHILVLEVFILGKYVDGRPKTEFSVEVHYNDQLCLHLGTFGELEAAARLAAEQGQGEAPIKLLMQWKRWGGAR